MAKYKKTTEERLWELIEELGYDEDTKGSIKDWLHIGERTKKANAKGYAEQHSEKLAVLAKKLKETPEGSIDADIIISEIEETQKKFLGASQDSVATRKLPSIVEAITEAKKDGESRGVGDMVGIDISGDGGYSYGFPELSKAIDGLQAGLTVIAGPSSVGKTAFAVSLLRTLIMDRLNNKTDISILYLAADDNALYAAQRFVSIFSGSGFNEVKKYKDSPNKEAIIKAYNIVKELDQAGIVKFLDIKHVKNMMDVKAYAETMLKQNPNLVIFLDGAYNIAPGDSARYELRSENIQRFNLLKDIADTYNLPILMTGEIPKSDQLADQKNPLYKDCLSETGKIVYHAGVILTIYPVSYPQFEIDKVKGKTETNMVIRIAKSKRSGGAGEIYNSLSLRTGEYKEIGRTLI